MATINTKPGAAAIDPPIGEALPDAETWLVRVDGLAGAPLDAIKLTAAIAMVVDHVYEILIDHDVMPMWYIGRIAFPLFCLALVCHLRRGANLTRYVQRLVVLAVVSQPIYAAAFRRGEADTIFTLAVGIVLAAALARAPRLVRHAVFAVAAAAVFVPWSHARSGIDYGLAGALFPAVLADLAEGRTDTLAWGLALLIGLNLHRDVSVAELAIATASAGFGSLAVVAVASRLRGRPRFLPRYAFYVFYPGHLLVLLMLRVAGV